MKTFDEEIIVTLTSYRKRINGVFNVVKAILNNSIVPKKIICNLSSDEFPKRESELPKELVNLQQNNIFEIYWVKENTFAFKKLIPTLKRYPNSVIISIDDDSVFDNKFVETMYSAYVKNGKCCPITGGSYKWDNNIYTHDGGNGTLVKAEFFGCYLNDLYDNFAYKYIINNGITFDDPLYTYAILLNGRRYKHVNTNKNDLKYAERITRGGETTYRKSLDNWHHLIRNYIKIKYNKSYDDLFRAPINVNFTTWRKRENAVPQMLDTILKQTMKPDRINLFLSKDEYNEVIPNKIENLYKQGIINNIYWVDGNTYSHKRWEAIKFYNNCYNIFVDDDVLYTQNHIKELYETAIKNQGCEIVWTSNIEEYSGKVRRPVYSDKSIKSKKLQTLSGMSCFPPYTYPLESFNETDKRDKWCTKCDDSWNRAWMIKNEIEIVRVHDRSKIQWKSVPNTEKDGIWETENKHIIGGAERMTINFANALICANAVQAAKKLWPNFDVYGVCNKDILSNEKLIVTMTSWKARIGNIPAVLDTIFKQTKQPDKIVINLSTEEFPNQEMDLPEQVVSYINNHSIVEINWVDGPNTKQWKKILPTLKLYPNDCIVCIDDDFIYPNDMLSTLWNAHIAHPNNPISGNSVRYNGIQCQCGCASLVKLEHLKNIFDYATPEVQKHHSSDIFFTYVAAKGGTPYIYCGKSYFTNMSRFNEIKPLHGEVSARNALNDMWNYLVTTFGNVVPKKKKSANSVYQLIM